MSKYRVTSLLLSKAQYSFVKPDSSQVSGSSRDDIKVMSVNENTAALRASRTIDFGKAESFITIIYDVTIKAESNLTTQEVIDDLKTGIPEMTVVYSKIVLLIAQLTEAGPFGPVITPPNYNINAKQ